MAVLTRLFFGASRAHEPPTPTEVWRIKERPPDMRSVYWRPNTMVQARTTASFIEIRRGPWLRLVGPVEDRLLADESVAEAKSVGAVLTTK